MAADHFRARRSGPPPTDMEQRCLLAFVLLNATILALCLATLWPIAAGAVAVLAGRETAERLPVLAGLVVTLLVFALDRGGAGAR